MGKSDRAVLQSIIDRHTDPKRLASRVTRGVKASRAEPLKPMGRMTCTSPIQESRS
ncbi:MAG: hypothetical protein KJZ83_17260 [Burkholderiaceae bacterium]|nr:hypothetical protein [Burkholderiaceae bacterium]